MKPVFISLLTLVAVFSTSCGGQYSEEERQTYIDAEKAHFEAIRTFGIAYDQLNVITSLQDSISSRVSTVDNYIGMEGVNTDSLEQVKSDLSAVTEDLTNAKNALLNWANEIYGLPDDDSPYTDESDSEQPSIAKDASNDMITNNIEYKDLPENVTPGELLKLQQEQLSNIESIHSQIEASIKKAKDAIAENL